MDVGWTRISYIHTLSALWYLVTFRTFCLFRILRRWFVNALLNFASNESLRCRSLAVDLAAFR